MCIRPGPGDRRRDDPAGGASPAPPAVSFGAIVDRYERPLRAYCARLVGPDLAGDAVQQAFLHALVALRRVPVDDVHLRRWLYRIAHNCAVDLLRRPGREWDRLDPALEGGAGPPEIVERRERFAAFLDAVRALPEAQQRALLLREVEGRSYDEIAARLGRSTDGVRQAIFRARATLRAEGDAQTPAGRMSDTADAAERELLAAAALWD